MGFKKKFVDNYELIIRNNHAADPEIRFLRQAISKTIWQRDGHVNSVGV